MQNRCLRDIFAQGLSSIQILHARLLFVGLYLPSISFLSWATEKNSPYHLQHIYEVQNHFSYKENVRHLRDMEKHFLCMTITLHDVGSAGFVYNKRTETDAYPAALNHYMSNSSNQYSYHVRILSICHVVFLPTTYNKCRPLFCK